MNPRHLIGKHAVLMRFFVDLLCLQVRTVMNWIHITVDRYTILTIRVR